MTEHKGILGMFAGHAFLQGFSERHLMTLASGASPFSFNPGEFLAREGEPAKAFYLIQSGHVSIVTHSPDRRTMPIQTVGPGDVIGWSWVVEPHRWVFDCQALDSVHGLTFDSEWLREACHKDYELGYLLLKHLLSVIAGRLAATRLQLLDLHK